MTKQELTELFTKLGAPNPECWASSQAEEGIPQLARFLFLRQAWRLIVREADTSWLQDQMQVDAGSRGGAIGPVLARLLEGGASAHDLTTVVRVMQWKLLTGLSYLLEDPGDTEDEVAHIAWRLFQVNESDEPISAISGLHESVLETDPSGREMRI
jgi:hypothetical protein